jgi:hypothetical protein
VVIGVEDRTGLDGMRVTERRKRDGEKSEWGENGMVEKTRWAENGMKRSRMRGKRDALQLVIRIRDYALKSLGAPLF